MHEKMILISSGKFFLLLGVFFGFLTVVIGAFGAHAMKQRLSPEMLGIMEVGVRYQMYHALALLCVGILLLNFPTSKINYVGWLFLVGTCIFSGSLYSLALTGVRAWGAVTPIGGVLLLFGWALLFWNILNLQTKG